MATSDHNRDNSRSDGHPESLSQDNLIARGGPPAARPAPRRAPPRRVAPQHKPGFGTPSTPVNSPAGNAPTVGPPDNPDNLLEGIKAIRAAQRAARSTLGSSFPEEAFGLIQVPEIERLVNTWKQQVPQQFIRPGDPVPPDPQPTPQQMLDLWNELYPSDSGRHGQIRDLLERRATFRSGADSFVENVYGAGLGAHRDPNQAFIEQTNASIRNRSPVQAPSARPSPQPSLPSAPPPDSEEQGRRRLKTQEAIKRAKAQEAQSNRKTDRYNHQAESNRVIAAAARQAAAATRDYSAALQNARLSVVGDLLSRFSPEQQVTIVETVVQQHNQDHPDEQLDPDNLSPGDWSKLEIDLLSVMSGMVPEQQRPIGDSPTPQLHSPSEPELERVKPPEEGPGTPPGPEESSLPTVKPVQSPPATGPIAPSVPVLVPQQPEGDEPEQIPVQPIENRQGASGGSDEGSEEQAASESAAEERDSSEEQVFESTGQPVVGRKLSGLTPEEKAELEQDYSIRNLKDGRQVIARQAGNTSPQLHLDKDGVIQPGSANNRSISNADRTKRNFKEAYGHELPKGFEHNHLAAVNKFNSDELLQEGEKRSPGLVDSARNILGMPSNAEAFDNSSEVVQELIEKGGLAKIIHRGSHAKWDRRVQEELDRQKEELKADYPGKTLEELDDDIILDAIHEVMDTLRQELIDYARQIERGDLEGLPDYIDPTYNPKDAPDRQLPKLVEQPSSTVVAQASPQRVFSPDQSNERPSVLEQPQTVYEFAQLSAYNLITYKSPAAVKEMEKILKEWQATAPEAVTSKHVQQQEHQLDRLQQHQKYLQSEKPKVTFEWRCCQMLGIRHHPLNFISMELEDHNTSRREYREVIDGLDKLKEQIPQQAEQVEQTREKAKTRSQWEREPRNQTYAEIASTFYKETVQKHLQEVNYTLESFGNAQEIAQNLGRSPEHIALIANATQTYLEGGGVSQEVLDLIAKDVDDDSAQQAELQAAKDDAAQETGGIELEIV